MKLTYEAVRDLLRTVGPMTSTELHEFFPNVPLRHVSAAVNRMRGLATRQVHISAWVREAEGKRYYLRAVYALGDRRDAPKPRPLDNAERCRRHKAKLAIGRGVPASIWDLARRAA